MSLRHLCEDPKPTLRWLEPMAFRSSSFRRPPPHRAQEAMITDKTGTIDLYQTSLFDEQTPID